MPDKHGRIGIGDRSRDGLLEITGTSWDGYGTLTVTVRELVGQPWESYPGDGLVIRRARTLARSALPEHYDGETRKSPEVRRWWADGCSHITFAVSRNEG